MITINDFNRLIGRIKSKLLLMVGRAILAAVDNSEKTQKLQIVALHDETITGIERFQEYGLETRPESDSEVLAVFINGNRDQGVAICVHDRRYRPQDLAEGEVALYTKDDLSSKDHRVHLKAGKAIDMFGTALKLGATSGHKTLCLSDLVDAINTLISVYNTHTHNETGAVTLVPNQLQTALVKATYATQETEAT